MFDLFLSVSIKKKENPKPGFERGLSYPNLSDLTTTLPHRPAKISEKFKYIPKGVALAPVWSENSYRFFPFPSRIGYGLQLNYGSV